MRNENKKNFLALIKNNQNHSKVDVNQNYSKFDVNPNTQLNFSNMGFN